MTTFHWMNVSLPLFLTVSHTHQRADHPDSLWVSLLTHWLTHQHYEVYMRPSIWTWNPPAGSMPPPPSYVLIASQTHIIFLLISSHSDQPVHETHPDPQHHIPPSSSYSLPDILTYIPSRLLTHQILPDSDAPPSPSYSPLTQPPPNQYTRKSVFVLLLTAAATAIRPRCFNFGLFAEYRGYFWTPRSPGEPRKQMDMTDFGMMARPPVQARGSTDVAQEIGDKKTKVHTTEEIMRGMGYVGT